MSRLHRGLRLVVLLAAVAAAIYPVWWLGTTSLKDRREVMKSPWGLPAQLETANYARVGGDGRFVRAYGNSAAVAVAAVLALTILGALAGYGFGRFDFRGKRWLWGAFLGGLFIPVHVTLIPLHRLEGVLGLTRGWGSLVFLAGVYVAFNLSFTVFFLSGFFRDLPDELEDAARVDGCGSFAVWWRVMLPLSLPALTVAGLVNLVMVWNEFVFALVLIRSSDWYTLPLAVKNFSDEQSMNLPLTAAALMSAIVPVLAVFVVCQRWIIRGMTAGAVKG